MQSVPFGAPYGVVAAGLKVRSAWAGERRRSRHIPASGRSSLPARRLHLQPLSPLASPQNNKLSGVLPSYANNPVLHIVHLDNNQFTGHLRATNYSALFTGGLITDLSVSSNR